MGGSARTRRTQLLIMCSRTFVTVWQFNRFDSWIGFDSAIGWVFQYVWEMLKIFQYKQSFLYPSYKEFHTSFSINHHFPYYHLTTNLWELE